MMLYSLCLFLAYFFLFLFYALFQKTKKRATQQSPKKIAILIPLRNEASNLPELFHDLLAQNHPSDLMHIVFWNDASTDQSKTLIESFIEANQEIQIDLVNEEEQIGKKQIIMKAVDHLDTEWILLCDADTRFGPDRLSKLCQYSDDRLDLIIGKVALSGNSFFQKLQVLEYDTMMTIAQATSNMGDPILGSSANLLFRTEAFKKAKPYQNNLNTASGDDVFLINSIKKLRKKNALFVSDSAAYVYSEAHHSVKATLRQRLRWAGKNPLVKDYRYQLAASASLFCNIVLVIMLIVALFVKSYQYVFLLAFGIKFISELILYFRMKKSEGLSLIHFLTLNLIYPFYVTLVGLLSFVIRPSWK